MKNPRIFRAVSALLCGACVLAAATALGAPKTISLYAKLVYLNPNSGATSPSPGPDLIPMWGFATSAAGTASVPGSQIDVGAAEFTDGLVITVYNLLTNLPSTDPVSLVIPGLNGSTNVGSPVRFAVGDPNYANRIRSFVPEVLPAQSRVYTWTGPLKPGTYVYHSGSHPALQVQMGLFGMLTVREAPTQAYPGINPNSEVPVIFSEIDPVLHWAVHTNGYGPGRSISSTIHSKPGVFLINGQAYDSITPPPALAQDGHVGQSTLFRMINVCWNTRIPVLGGPFPSAEGSYLKVVAEDGKPYLYPKTLYAPDLPAMKTKDALFTPVQEGSYRLYDRKLGLGNGDQPAAGGMLRRWEVAAGSVGPVLAISPLSLSFTATAGGANPASQLLNISNAGGGSLDWTTTVTSGPPWLSAAPAAGTGNGSVSVSANISGLIAGTYSGTINVGASGAGGSPQTINVSLAVVAVATPSVGVATFNSQSSALLPTSHSLTGVPAGALLVLTSQSSPGLQANATVSSSPSLTWTKRADAAQSGSSGSAEIWSAVYAGGGNISVSSSWGALIRQSSVCYVITNSEPVLGGASAVQTSQSAPLVNITTTRANGILVCVTSDRSGQNGASRVYRDGAAETLYFRQTGAGSTTGYHYYKAASAMGPYTEGLTTPTGQQAGTCVLEIRSQP